MKRNRCVTFTQKETGSLYFSFPDLELVHTFFIFLNKKKSFIFQLYEEKIVLWNHILS